MLRATGHARMVDGKTHPLKVEDVPHSTITLTHTQSLTLTSNYSSCTNLPRARTDYVTSKLLIIQPVVRSFASLTPKGASKMLRATGHARMVKLLRVTF